MTPPGFHTQDGLFFERRDDGTVHVRVMVPVFVGYEDGEAIWGPQAVVFQTILPASSFASMVASVSQHGETRETWEQALKFHGEPA